MKDLSIPDDLYTTLLEKTLDLNFRTPVDVIRFLLSNTTPKEILDSPLNNKKNDLVAKGGTIPHGTKLQCTYKGRLFHGIVDNGTIILDDGKTFPSPSKAAVYVAGLQGMSHASINGWQFWEYFDTKTKNWNNLSILRKENGLRTDKKNSEILVCKCRSKDLHARGKYDGKYFIVLKDSKANGNEAPSQPHANRIAREQLIKKGVLSRNGDHFIFTRDYRFNSPSSAAGVVLGRSANGKTEWLPEI